MVSSSDRDRGMYTHPAHWSRKMASPVLLEVDLEAKIDLPEPLMADEALYELVNGRRVEIPPMSIRAAIIASRLVAELNIFMKDDALGEVFPETVFRIALPEDMTRERRPDIAFVSY